MLLVLCNKFCCTSLYKRIKSYTARKGLSAPSLDGLLGVGNMFSRACLPTSPGLFSLSLPRSGKIKNKIIFFFYFSRIIVIVFQPSVTLDISVSPFLERHVAVAPSTRSKKGLEIQYPLTRVLSSCTLLSVVSFSLSFFVSWRTHDTGCILGSRIKTR